MSTRKETIGTPPVSEPVVCYHCGDPCRDETIHAHEKTFCCEGCKLVFEILDENNLCNYYNLNEAPGTKEKGSKHAGRYDFLEDEKVRQQLISFTDGQTTNITLFIPQVHCSSCIWLLEHLYKLDKGVKRSTVNFLRREVSLVFDETETNLKKIALLLDRLGYPPHISLDHVESRPKPPSNRQTYYKLGVAFFCFGNIMLLSFPEYFGLNHVAESHFRNLFGYLNILLSLPVLLYADTGFFKSAWSGLRQGRLNMDFPISLGIIVMYGRSLFEILSGTGAGYMDTFAGLIFFMLTGRLFQDKTYQRLSFERDYKSYFPVAVSLLRDGKETTKPVNDLSKGDRILIRNEELIPADAILIKGEASIDYSFVTGENIPVPRKSGDKIYAGGKQMGPAIELEVVDVVSQSKLTRLWNESNYSDQQEKDLNSIVDRVSKVFTIVVVLIAAFAGIWYTMHDMLPKALNSFTAVLIITCPCALALSYPFALGNSIRILGKQGFFLKNTHVIEKMSGITDVVFDKTGTLTKSGEAGIGYEGEHPGKEHTNALYSLFAQSSHPLSRMLYKHLSHAHKVPVTGFRELPGKGITGVINGQAYHAGSASFTGFENDSKNTSRQTRVHWNYNGVHMGYFTIANVYRDGIENVTNDLSDNYELHLLSGDNDSERNNLTGYFKNAGRLHFNQTPAEKLEFIQSLQSQGKHVAMLGDGLNDAGALKQSDCGIAISDNVNNFSPACDGILDAGAFKSLPDYFRFSRNSMKIIYMSYLISFLYNCVGIWFAVQGNLSPLFAAVIMPLSTITIILFTTLSTNLAAKINNLKI